MSFFKMENLSRKISRVFKLQKMVLTKILTWGKFVLGYSWGIYADLSPLPDLLPTMLQVQMQNS